MDKLRDLIGRRISVKEELQRLTQVLVDTETETKQELIDLGSYECLTIRWDRVKRMCGK